MSPFFGSFILSQQHLWVPAGCTALWLVLKDRRRTLWEESPWEESPQH